MASRTPEITLLFVLSDPTEVSSNYEQIVFRDGIQLAFLLGEDHQTKGKRFL
jgi:hypothetical protein